MKKKNKKTNKWLILGISLGLCLLLVCSMIIDRKTGKIETILKDIVAFTEKVVIYPFTALNKEKNQVQTESYTIQKNKNETLEKEIAELKEVLDLNKTLTEYEPVNATVLSRNKSYWLQTITIDKGKSSGLMKDMAVMTKKGLIGKITKVYDNCSEVKLLTANDEKFKVSITIKTGEVDHYAILDGYDKKTGLIKATGIDKMITIQQGDTVLTSGLGSMFPSGLFIGTVERVENDKYNLSKTAYIKTTQDYRSIHYVTVLKVKS